MDHQGIFFQTKIHKVVNDTAQIINLMLTLMLIGHTD